ncbi:MAG TPA: hypothetical protein VNF92_00830 [Gemmatimonadaceae bacterium]|nr:hypothetical protein [Gemmatimonadaceae bacterium]
MLAASPPDTTPAAGHNVPDSIPRSIVDTVHRRPRAVEVSDAYYTRLQIHQWSAYSIIPLFAFQYVAGNRLFNDPAAAPTWAKTGHRVGATLLATAFTVSTVTGLWNLWDSRSVPENRALRYVHALSMLAADGAFTYAGSTLATQAQNSLAKRREHRTVTLAAMGVTLASALMMKIWNAH